MRTRRNSTATRTEVRSPTRTSTSTKADTRGNLTVTGGAGDGDTTVRWGRNPRPRRPRGRRNPGGGGDSTGLLLLAVGAAFLLFTSTGKSLVANLSTATTGLPTGTTRLANGQYKLSNGQIVGPPYAGYQAYVGSDVSLAAYVKTVSTGLSAVSSLVGLWQKIVGSTNPAPIIPATGVVALPAKVATMQDGMNAIPQIDSTGAVVGYYAPNATGTMNLYDASGRLVTADVLPPPSAELSAADMEAWLVSDFATMPAADFTDGVPLLFDLSSSAEDLAALTAELAAFDDAAAAFSFGGLDPRTRVGYVPVPMRHG